MLIARLIADHVDLETRLDAMRRGLLHASHDDIFTPPEEKLLDLGGDAGGTVLELQFDASDPRLAFNVIETHFETYDALVCTEEITIPRLFISDMDSTMIGQECIDELADYAGLKDKIADITERAMQGELDFEDALRERVALLEGLEVSAIDRCLDDRITPTPGAKILSKTLKAMGCRNVLVTGGFHHFGDVVAEWLGFDRVVGNRLGTAGGRLTGQLDGPITDAGTKKAVLIEEAAKIGGYWPVLATGDGANDIPMIDAATYGFAYRAKPKARAAANGRVDHGDLTAVLSLLGIPQKDWVLG